MEPHRCRRPQSPGLRRWGTGPAPQRRARLPGRLRPWLPARPGGSSSKWPWLPPPSALPAAFAACCPGRAHSGSSPPWAGRSARRKPFPARALIRRSGPGSPWCPPPSASSGPGPRTQSPPCGKCCTPQCCSASAPAAGCPCISPAAFLGYTVPTDYIFPGP